MTMSACMLYHWVGISLSGRKNRLVFVVMLNYFYLFLCLFASLCRRYKPERFPLPNLHVIVHPIYGISSYTYIYIICIIRTTRPGARGRPAITTRTTRFRRAVHPRQHSSKSREHLFRKPSPGKPGRPLQKKRPSRADSLHYACKPFRVPHTSGALTTCPANATTSRRHGKNPAYCLSINSITQAGYKDKKFIFNNALYAPNAHHTAPHHRAHFTGRRRKAYFTGRTGSNSCGHHFMSNFVKKIHPPDISRFPYGDWLPCVRNHSGAVFFVTFPPHLRCISIINLNSATLL